MSSPEKTVEILSFHYRKPESWRASYNKQSNLLFFQTKRSDTEGWKLETIIPVENREEALQMSITGCDFRKSSSG